MFSYPKIRHGLFATMMVSALLLGGCNEDETFSQSVPDIRITLPDSLTGGTALSQTKSAKDRLSSVHRSASANEPCLYLGEDDEDMFRNGYTMSRMMISAVATWSCIADLVIDVAGYIEHDGLVHQSDNNREADSYDPEDATHYSITDEQDGSIVVRLYYGYNRDTPPTYQTQPDLFIAWIEYDDGSLAGRIVIDGEGVKKDALTDPEDPVMMRMDLTRDASSQQADMYLKFADEHDLINGFRIFVQKDLNVYPLTKVYTAKGILDLKKQYLPDTGVSETPQLQVFAVANQDGDGATIANFIDVAVSLALNAELENHLGNYLFTKVDKYFFDANQNGEKPWDYINKTVTTSEFRGGRTTPATGGSWEPDFNPSLDLLILAFQLDSDYFTGDKCAAISNDCNDFMNALFEDGFAGQEQNLGSDPMDWRSDELLSAAYLSSVYPDGYSDWNGVFEPTFNP